MKGRFLFLTLAAALACLSFSPSLAQEEARPEPATLQAVLAHAYAHNPALLAARAEYKAVQEGAPQAWARWQPTVSSSAGVTASDMDGSNFGIGGSSTAKDLGVSFSQPLYRGGRSMAELEAAQSLIDAQAHALRAREQEILLQAAQAWLSVWQSTRVFLLTAENRDAVARELEAAYARFDAGEVTRTDVAQAQARLAEAEAGIMRAQGTLNTARAALQSVSGMDAGDIWREPSIGFTVPSSRTEVEDLAEKNSPAVLYALSVHRASEGDVDKTFGELLPEVGVGGSWNRTLDPAPGLVDEQTVKTVGLSATLPLYEGGAVRSRVRQAKYTENRRYLEILDARRQAREKAAARWEEWQVAKAEIEARRAQADAAATAREGVGYETALGSRSVLDALDAQREVLSAQIALAVAEATEISARFAVMESAGILNPEHLGFAPEPLAPQGSPGMNLLKMDVDRVGTDE